MSAAAADVGSSSSSILAEQLAELRASAPIWQHPPLLDAFPAQRNAAKALAKAIADAVQ